MKTPNLFFKMNNRLSLAVVLALVILMVSCKKDPVFDDPNSNPDITTAPTASIVDEIIADIHYYTEDSISNINFVDYTTFGQDTLVFRLLNNLGVGRDTAGSLRPSVLEILDPNPIIDPIVKYKIDECFRKKIVISWNSQDNQRIADSIMIHDSNYSKLHQGITSPSSWRKDFDTVIYIDLFVLNRFGEVELDIENPRMNEFLFYKSSKYNGHDKDSIMMSPSMFYDIYGIEYVSAMTLGNLGHFEFSIRNIDYNHDDAIEIFNEAYALIKKSLRENISWNVLKQNSTFFKKSTIRGNIKYTIGYDHARCFYDEPMELNAMFDDYKDGDIGAIDLKYKPYNTIYPKYDFLK